MAVIRDHFFYYEEIFSLEGVIRDPVLTFGFQDCLYHPPRSRISVLKRRIQIAGLQWFHRHKLGGVTFHEYRNIPPKLEGSNLTEVLANFGATNVTTLDYFDDRADIKHDMNEALPAELAQTYNTVIDIGSMEHVFDPCQCIKNLISLVQRGGHLVLVGPCYGYYKHGFHTFNPEWFLGVLSSNGFEIVYRKYSSQDGIEVENPLSAPDCLIWIVARYESPVEEFRIPQQGEWEELYRDRPKQIE